MKARPKKLTMMQRTMRGLLRDHRRVTEALVKTSALMAAPAHVVPPVRSGPARFIQCWAVSGRPVTQALDEDGLVWELHTVIDKATGQVTEQFWTRLGMERRNT